MNSNSHTVMDQLDIQSVRQKIAELIHDFMGIPVENVLEDIPFTELHKDFDSLTMLEVQLLLEKEYNFEFEIDLHNKNAKLPSNATELAQELIKQYSQYLVKQQAKTDEATTKKAT